MIFRIWVKIFSVVALVAIPLLLANIYLQRESLNLVSSLHDKGRLAEIMEEHLDLLKRMAGHEPAREVEFRKKFTSALESKLALEDLSALKDSISKQILLQTGKITLMVLLLGLVLSFFFSKNIVALFSRLHKENTAQSRRLEMMNAIESWQKLARMLVHELRAPLTPLKLVAGDIENKYRALPSDKFGTYLSEGAALMNEQIATVEAMIDNFLKFAKLPAVKKKTTSLQEFLGAFVQTYRDFDKNLLELGFKDESGHPVTVALDQNLASNLLFNLIRNALEANTSKKIAVHIVTSTFEGKAHIEVRNDGALIPPELEKKIFDPYVSSKEGDGKMNLGLGLTISKKIALDHGGDLYLKHNDAHHGVGFEFELPMLEKTL